MVKFYFLLRYFARRFGLLRRKIATLLKTRPPQAPSPKFRRRKALRKSLETLPL